MSQTLSLGPFRGLFSAGAGDAPLGFAGSLLNVRLGDGAIRPRYGYRNLAGAPTGLAAVHGLVRLSGYGDDYAHVVEWVTVENRDGVVKPYSVDPTTWERTEITNERTALGLAGGDWLGFAYNGASYFVNPGAARSLWKHEVGNDASWTALEDAEYVPAPDDPTFEADLNAPYAYPFGLSGDTFAVSGPGVSGATAAANADTSLTVSGSAGNDSQTSANSIVTLTFGAAQDLSTSDYVGFLARGEDVFVRFKTGVLLELKIGGAWSTPEQRPFLSEDRTRTGVVMRIKGLAGANAVQAVRFTVRAEPQPHHSGKAYTLQPLQVGGSYLAATLVGDRPWDPGYKTADVTYAARYKKVSDGSVTGIKQATRDRSIFGNYDLGAGLSGSVLGDRISLSVEPLTTGGYSDDPSGASYRIEYLRLDRNGAWHSLGTTPNTTGQTFRDRLEERELQALPTTTVTGYVAPENPPVFSASGFVAGVAFKGWVVWFTQGGKGNVQHSRVGNAEALYSPGDDVDDEGRGATFTLADDFADEPLGGVQAGDALLIAGREGIYGQSGNSPSTMTPPRKLPGSMGCAGRFAFARYRDEAGNYGLAWLDVPGEAVWFASASLAYSSDTQARPSEISAPIRGSVRSFLYEEQQESDPGLSLSSARLDVDEATGSLWVVLGARALVLRPPSPIDGQRQWERHHYALGSGSNGAVSSTSDPMGPTSGISQARTGQTLGDWASPGAVVPGPGVASSGSYLPGARSRWLRGVSFGPWTYLPAEATLTGLTLVVRHRSVPSGEFPTTVVLGGWEAILGGAALDSGAGGLVPSAWEDRALPIDVGSATLAQVNAGLFDARVGYDASPAKAFNANDWAVTYSVVSGSCDVAGDGAGPTPWTGSGPWFIEGDGTSATSAGTARVTYRWVGSGPPPDSVVARVTTTLTAGAGTTAFSAQGSTNAVTTKKYLVSIDPLTGIGSVDVAMSATGNASAPPPGGGSAG